VKRDGRTGVDVIEVRVLDAHETLVLDRVADGVFDGPVRHELAAGFLSDPRHHLAVAVDDGTVVGMASGVHYLHPDKRPELWVNEVGVAPTHRRRCLARRLLEALMEHARALGCTDVWVLTDRDNAAARALYDTLGGEADESAVLYAWRLDTLD
jgi:ribosomal protein S18 acetylase RimI-like enzyme